MATHLSEDTLSELRTQLETRRRDLKEEIRQELLASDKPDYQELAGTVHDTGEEAVAELIADMNLAFADRHVQELHEIEGALQRMQNGTYGYCMDCSEAINPQRLAVWPTARRCRDCQEIYEQRSAIQQG